VVGCVFGGCCWGCCVCVDGWEEKGGGVFDSCECINGIWICRNLREGEGLILDGLKRSWSHLAH